MYVLSLLVRRPMSHCGPSWWDPLFCGPNPIKDAHPWYCKYTHIILMKKNLWNRTCGTHGQAKFYNILLVHSALWRGNNDMQSNIAPKQHRCAILIIHSIYTQYPIMMKKWYHIYIRVQTLSPALLQQLHSSHPVIFPLILTQSLPLKNIPTAWCCHHHASR